MTRGEAMPWGWAHHLKAELLLEPNLLDPLQRLRAAHARIARRGDRREEQAWHAEDGPARHTRRMVRPGGAK